MLRDFREAGTRDTGNIAVSKTTATLIIRLMCNEVKISDTFLARSSLSAFSFFFKSLSEP
jgi:hypothetical protein